MDMYLGGRWVSSPKKSAVVNPNTGETIAEVPIAAADQIEAALAAAVQGAADMARLPVYRRVEILEKAAAGIAAHTQELARTITAEEGKPLRESLAEVARGPDLLKLCAFEGAQLRGETLPLDAQRGVTGKLGLTLRVPCGVVLAITPFNYPLLLVLHKIGPALAAGNAVILKPAEQTPLTALQLVKIFLDAGLPPNALQCVTGPGEVVGLPLTADPRVRKISLTGSTAAGEAITKSAGVKRLSLELGSNAAVVALADADPSEVAAAVKVAGYVNAGQVCISAQRVLVHERAYADFLDALKKEVEEIRVGDPLAESTQLSAMVSETAAKRVEGWMREAVQQGARLVTGGARERALLAPTVIADVRPHMRVFRQELFGPAVAVTRVATVDEAIRLVNDSEYGLAAGIFTRDMQHALRFASKVEAGNIMVNSTPLWRADLMPYGGLKRSGFGKEGPRYALEEMTELKTIVFHGLES
ncbi:MAG: aldehyde dehydrogenase family protein [Vicinamibacteraceae bacterium]